MTAAREPSTDVSHQAGAKLRRPIAVVVSRFPVVTETFILREIDELERQGQPVILVPLIEDSQGVVHREVQPWLERMLHAPFLSTGVLVANARMLGRARRQYLSLLAELVTGASRSLNVLVRTLVLFPKSVYLAARLEELGVRHVHAHFATYPATTAFVVWRLTGIGYSFTAHAHDVFVPWRRASLSAKVRHARFVRAVAEYGRDRLRAICGESSADVEVIHVGVDTATYTPPRRDDGAPPTVLCVAALKPYKGLAVLLEACQRLRQSGVHFRCDIVGEGPLRGDIERLRRLLRLDDCVQLRGALRQDEVAGLTTAADVAVAPSIVAPDGQMDGIPVALMEAMAAGRPVVASRLSGIPELVDDGVDGLLVEPGDPPDLAAALRRLLEDPALAARMGRAGREKVYREFRLQPCVARLLDRIDAHNPPADESAVESWSGAVRELLPAHRIGVRCVHRRPDSTVVELLAVSGSRARDLVLKIHGVHSVDERSAAERARHEFDVLSWIGRMSAERPPGALFGYGAPHALDIAGPALVMERCSGRSLIDYIRAGRGVAGASGAIDAHRAVWGAGRWLREFQEHSARRADPGPVAIRIAERGRRDLNMCAGIVLGTRGSRRIRERLDALAAAAADGPRREVFRHGDFWPGNVFVDSERVEVIDFEGCGDGLQYEDVAYFLEHLELFFVHPLRRRWRGSVRAAFLDGYVGDGQLHESTYELCRLATALQTLAKAAERDGPVSWADQWRLRAIRHIALHWS